LSTDLEEKSNFHFMENTFVNIDAEVLNDVLRTNGHTMVNKDDDINEQ
jgi:hypothetical protein